MTVTCSACNKLIRLRNAARIRLTHEIAARHGPTHGIAN